MRCGSFGVLGSPESCTCRRTCERSEVLERWAIVAVHLVTGVPDRRLCKNSPRVASRTPEWPPQSEGLCTGSSPHFAVAPRARRHARGRSSPLLRSEVEAVLVRLRDGDVEPFAYRLPPLTRVNRPHMEREV
jgi:hypothetical protein